MNATALKAYLKKLEPLLDRNLQSSPPGTKTGTILLEHGEKIKQVAMRHADFTENDVVIAYFASSAEPSSRL